MESIEVVENEAVHVEDETLIEEDDILVDEVSIDGMCGVY